MGTVYAFPRGHRLDETKTPRGRARLRRIARAVVRVASEGVLYLVRTALFLVLLWLRRPLRWILGFVSSGLILGAIAIAVGLTTPHHEKIRLLAATSGLGLGSFAIMWFYDALLLRLSPEPITLLF